MMMMMVCFESCNLVVSSFPVTLVRACVECVRTRGHGKMAASFVERTPTRLPSQVMSAGTIPVFVVRDWIKPFQEQVDWPSFSFTFSPDQLGPEMVDVLKAVPADQLIEMQVQRAGPPENCNTQLPSFLFPFDSVFVFVLFFGHRLCGGGSFAAGASALLGVYPTG